MSKVLIIAEHDGTALNVATARCVSCALAIGGDIDVAVLGQDVSGVAAEASKLEGASRVLTINAEHLAHPLAADWAPEIAALATDYTHVLGPSTTFGKDLMPRVAALLGVNQFSDVMEVLDATGFRRPIYAGNAIIDARAPEGTKVVMTVRAASWPQAGEGGSAPVESSESRTGPSGHTRYVGLESGGDGERPDLQSATMVVSGGRALGSSEKFEVIYNFADKLGAAVGASRAAVDAGYVPNDMQVGQTGKIISPDLYWAFGISGAIQHVTGIKDAGTIVAINKDAEAPIFEIADIGLVGDLFAVIPEIEALLN